ncbi:MAG TPA: hypothetical protein VFF27_01325 [Bacteroidia bacterium]|nr:hypothetical protein [Bacteroidia bacterium]
MKKTKIAIFTATADVFTNPTLVSFLELLQEKNIDVLLFSYEQAIAAPSYFKNITYHFLPPLRQNFEGIKNSISSFRIYLNAIKILKSNSVIHMFGVDYYGFVVAARLKRFISKSQLSYFSFELLFLDEITDPKYITLKKKEKNYLKAMDNLIIQDDARLDLFLNENNLKKPHHFKVFKIPVAPKKIAMEHIVGVNLHALMNIPAEKKIMAYSGSIGDWAGTEQLLDLLEKHWNEKFWLVIHSRLPLQVNDIYHIRIKKLIAEGYPISLHANPFDNYLDYAAFLKNVDVAIVLYKSKPGSMYFGKNLQEIGLASGKFSMYLMMGIPVITSNQQSYVQLLKKFNFGGVILRDNEFPQLLERCIVNKSSMHERALQLYDAVLEPQKQLLSLIDTIN